MAATPSKQPPVKLSIDGGDAAGNSTLATAPVATSANNDSPAEVSPVAADAATASVKPAPTSPTSIPTYQSVEFSDIYLLAKRHLNDGKFEEAMTVIEEGIRDTQSLLQHTMDSPDGDYTLHESMAPFHYLYGTTLLYSIEEQDQEVTTAGSTVSTAVVSGEAAAAAGPEMDVHAMAADDGVMATASAEDIADEMQIAWENFETARHIMETMMANNDDDDESEENTEQVQKLELDLAQICLREGDLQRMNGRNETAIHDYEACLKLRKKSPFLGVHDRKIADVHYNLGLVYINVASKDDEEEETPEGEAAAKPSEDDDRVKEAKREMARNKSVYHFLECSKCFCGQIASICDADAISITRVDDAVGDEVGAKPKANYKTTGEEDEEMELPKVASAKLKTMRSRVTDLVSNTATLTVDQREQVEDLCQLLGDIQETVDEAENSTKGVQEVANMKAQVAALAAADGEIGESNGVDGGVTTIGFGSASATAASPAVASSVAITSAAAVPARPMMVVKKKKRAAVQPVQEPDTKKPKAAE